MKDPWIEEGGRGGRHKKLERIPLGSTWALEQGGLKHPQKRLEHLATSKKVERETTSIHLLRSHVTYRRVIFLVDNVAVDPTGKML